ncbi:MULTISPECIES: GIY-YIG nuclease family protein [unclassified Marinobacterium]|uniref:GIY-YIG nuclease family protein n=1 Tax=unclassified Marinobacterium TaxID=2644139 RepID=UPI0015692D7A|nr:MULTISPECIES: GIY-YIG nuclease family protein [unclassified Marinobacterium]NRP10368.1 T5orf17-2 domain protein [Marinobacterium sp. xm-g-48]NRP83467.1 T5orf17-2 domain protein [Marinobacterium sp. xm-d-509]
MASIRLRSKQPRRTLDEIFSEPDEYGLLDDRPAKQPVTRIDQSRFEEINVFVDSHNREPLSDGDLSEKTLARRLAAFRNDSNLSDGLQAFDRHGLLVCDSGDEESNEWELVSCLGSDSPIDEIDESATSLDDIFNSDAFGALGGDSDEDIFQMTHVPAVDDKNRPDEIAQRKKCEDFYQFKSIFEKTQSDIDEGKVEAVTFARDSQIDVGDMFIYLGNLLLVDEVGEYEEDDKGRYNPRLRVIYDNGTESNILFRSLGRGLHKDPHSKRIIREADSVVDAFSNITHKDKRSGQIYFLRSLSENPNIKAIPNLVKIGYTENTVEERTKNAEKDPTFLEAPVKIVGAFECFNLNPNRFETLIHGVLHAQKLRMTLMGSDGKTYHPNEWFMVDLETAKEVATRIIDGSIVKYRMNNTTGQLVSK